MAAYLMVVFAASVGMVRTVRRCDPEFGWVSAIVELRPLRNGTRLAVWLSDAAVVGAFAAGVAAVVVAAVVDAVGDNAGAGVGDCDTEPCSPDLETDWFAVDVGRCSVSVWVQAERKLVVVVLRRVC